MNGCQLNILSPKYRCHFHSEHAEHAKEDKSTNQLRPPTLPSRFAAETSDTIQEEADELRREFALAKICPVRIPEGAIDERGIGRCVI
jgi:hypothetical protein